MSVNPATSQAAAACDDRTAPHLSSMAARAGRNGKTKRDGTKQRRATVRKPSSYDRFKEFQGKRYTGMQVGRRHRWHYDPGDWSEKKVTPDKWEFAYSVCKRRAGHAPEGSGAPVGTAYRWYILASQVVTKQDANSSTTEMAGLKYKLAHRRADKTSWSASDRAQRKRLIQILEEMIAELDKQPEDAPLAQLAGAPDGQAVNPTSAAAAKSPDSGTRNRLHALDGRARTQARTSRGSKREKRAAI